MTTRYARMAPPAGAKVRQNRPWRKPGPFGWPEASRSGQALTPPLACCLDWPRGLGEESLPMPIELKKPGLSPTLEEWTLAKWLVKEGASVAAGVLLAKTEADKGTT